MNRLLVLTLLAPALLSGACAKKPLYDWGSYEGDLYKVYKSPGSEREFAQDLRTMIDESRKKGTRTPPGVAAEYGFLQYKAGQLDEAVAYFDLERTSWPESAFLMTRLIQRIEEQKQGRGPDEPAPDVVISEGRGSAAPDGQAAPDGGAGTAPEKQATPEEHGAPNGEVAPGAHTAPDAAVSHEGGGR